MAGFSGRLFLTLDGGNNWFNASGGFGLFGQAKIKSPVLDIAISPTNPGIVFAGLSGDGIFKTTNGGITWTQVRKGSVAIGQTDNFLVVRIAPSSPSTIYAAGFSQFNGGSFYCSYAERGCVELTGVLPFTPIMSIDGGSTWTNITIPQSPSFPYSAFLLTDLALDPTNKNAVYAATLAYTNPFFFTVGNQGAFKSMDAGNTWVPINDPGITNLSLFPVFQLFLSPESPKSIYGMAGFSGIFKSTNAGESWAEMTSSGLPFPTFIRASAIGGNRIYSLTSAGIYVHDK